MAVCVAASWCSGHVGDTTASVRVATVTAALCCCKCEAGLQPLLQPRLLVWVAAWVSTPTTRSYSSATVRTGHLPLGQRDGEMSAREVRRQTCIEARPWSDRLLIKPSERAKPASLPAIDGHIPCKASADLSNGPRSRVTQEPRPQPRRHQPCQPAPGQAARALQVTQSLSCCLRGSGR